MFFADRETPAPRCEHSGRRVRIPFGLIFSVILHVLFPLSAYISLNAPLYPIPSSIYLPPSVIRPLISALAPLYCNSMLLTVSLIYLSSPFSKGHYTHSLFCQIKIEAYGKEDEVCHMCQPPTLSNAQHTHMWMQMHTRTHTHTDVDANACSHKLPKSAKTHRHLYAFHTCAERSA